MSDSVKMNEMEKLLEEVQKNEWSRGSHGQSLQFQWKGSGPRGTDYRKESDLLQDWHAGPWRREGNFR